MFHIVQPGESLAIIAKNYRKPIATLLASNPTIKNLQIHPGQTIFIPGLPNPNTIPFQIRVSKSAKTLSLLKNGITQKTYPIATGKILTQTPAGEFIIVNREPNPGGPFGAIWLSLSKAGYGIHGTNKPSSIGKSVSKGCIRMFNKDVLELARIVPNGTRVFIQP